MVGPGVRHLGVLDNVWTDHTDVRPTMLALLGLTDDYVSDGRVIAEALYGWAIPPTLQAHRDAFLRLSAAYKQLNAPFGELSMSALRISTRALASDEPGDATYTALEAKIADWTTQRDRLAGQIKALLDGASFHGQAFNELQARSLTRQAQALTNEVVAAAG
jgi:hypothetical protein